MTSREKILMTIKANQPATTKLPNITEFDHEVEGSLLKFSSVLAGVGGKVAYVSGYPEIIRIILNRNDNNLRIVSPVKELSALNTEKLVDLTSSHNLHNVEWAILNAQFGVAENGAVWITDKEMGQRVLPFVTQHLAVVIKAANIVATMHQAYELISKTTYGFGTFIAGPSKTADIEQSLVIGAHGPRSMTVFIIEGHKHAEGI